MTLLLCAGSVACTGKPAEPPLRLGTTYTVEQSGALALLDSLKPSVPLRVVVGASGQILRSAAAGDLDVVLTHAPSLEQRLLLTPGHAALRCPFVASRFAIVGPAADPARVAAARTAAEAFQRIATARAAFVSRGDSSGTHVKELSLWKAAGLSPGERDSWYVQAGVDQAATLRIADERHAYALADLPTFTRLRDLDLQVLFAADTVLANPYTLYVMRSPSAHPAAARFAAWALTDWRARLLALRLSGGAAAFAPLAGGCIAPPPVAAP
ncbi:MAG TPA: substrate-binding domain-containing protein [Gemmatimonadales bacterium]|nr:substrate-binding domain-containing protein [Gemmatimonadales bacterium]